MISQFAASFSFFLISFSSDQFVSTFIRIIIISKSEQQIVDTRAGNHHHWYFTNPACINHFNQKTWPDTIQIHNRATQYSACHFRHARAPIAWRKWHESCGHLVNQYTKAKTSLVDFCACWREDKNRRFYDFNYCMLLGHGLETLLWLDNMNRIHNGDSVE